MMVDKSSVDEPPDDLVLAHLVVAATEVSEKTGSCYVVGVEVGWWAP